MSTPQTLKKKAIEHIDKIYGAYAPVHHEDFVKHFLAGYRQALEDIGAYTKEQASSVPAGEWGLGAQFAADKIAKRIRALGGEK